MSLSKPLDGEQKTASGILITEFSHEKTPKRVRLWQSDPGLWLWRMWRGSEGKGCGRMARKSWEDTVPLQKMGMA